MNVSVASRPFDCPTVWPQLMRLPQDRVPEEIQGVRNESCEFLCALYGRG